MADVKGFSANAGRALTTPLSNLATLFWPCEWRQTLFLQWQEIIQITFPGLAAFSVVQQPPRNLYQLLRSLEITV